MNISIPIDEIYHLLSKLSIENKKWLVEKLVHDVSLSEATAKTQKLSFPHIPANRPISKEVLNMVIGTLPRDFDIEKETDLMWEERTL